MKDFMIAVTFWFVIVFLFVQCVPHAACPTVGTYRCVKDTVEYCSSDNAWHEIEECGRVVVDNPNAPQWHCEAFGGMAECVQ